MWHYIGLICIIATFIAVVLIGGFIVVLFIWQLGCYVGIHLEARFVQRRLISRGRFREWSEIVDTFRQGRGTLIVQYATPLGWLHGGPIYEWWTEDNLIERAPFPLPASWNELPSEPAVTHLLAFSKEMAAQYVDVDSGVAVLTIGPKRPGWWFERGRSRLQNNCPRITGRRLAETYPKGIVVTLLPWHEHDWLLMLGDADVVFGSGMPA